MDKKKIIMMIIIIAICVCMVGVAIYFINVNKKNSTLSATNYREAYNSLSEEEKQTVKSQYDELKDKNIDEETMKNTEIPEEIQEVILPSALTGPIDEFINSRN